MKIPAWGVVASTFLSVGLSAVSVPAAAGYTQTNLVSDLAGATLLDPSLVNPWGMSASAGSPFWVSDNGTGVTTLYNVDPATNVPTKVALTVTIPPSPGASPTGQVFNSAAAGGTSTATIFSL